MDEVRTCVFCDEHLQDLHKDIYTDVLTVYCPNCGQYRISRDANDDLPAEFKRKKSVLPAKYLISAVLRDNFERGLSTPVITNSNVHSIVDPGRIPKGVMQQLERYLLYIYRHSEYLGQPVPMSSNQLAVAFARNNYELGALTTGLVELGWAKTVGVNNDKFSVVATIEGMDHASKVFSTIGSSKQAFVAMWFEPEMDRIYDKHILPAIKRSGYNALVIRAKEHNNDVNTEIVAEILNSRFMVADFTGQRGGVYFEAGYALGLKKPVIWTCRKDWFNTVVDISREVIINGHAETVQFREERRTHFDVEHFGFIIWNTGEELEEKLYNRIRATISDAGVIE
jgi:nucleoside 2-deoxyribosyltransferase/predicted RNA-binding Zn-ribbon protein involved in translation (DUF1610 family)